MRMDVCDRVSTYTMTDLKPKLEVLKNGWSGKSSKERKEVKCKKRSNYGWIVIFNFSRLTRTGVEVNGGE